MFEKTLTDIVKGIRASKRDTALYISQCIAEIKTEINSSDMYVKANALQKLTFLQMMGYSMSWASFASIEVMSSPRFAHKRIGYLSASQGFTQDTDVVLLTTNLLKKELRGAVGGSMSGVYEAGLAINCLSNIVTEELAQDLLPELTNLTQHPQPYVRKKAILCLFKVFVKYPQGLRLTFAQIQQCLDDSNEAVVSCAVNVITELSDKNPRNYLQLAPSFFSLLTNSSNNWMLIKVVKLLGSLVPEEPRLARKLLEPLANIVRSTPAKSLMYEAVHAITLCLPYCRKTDGSMPAAVPEIVALCAQTLKEFVEEKDQNLKYLGLVGFNSLMISHPKVLSAPNYRPLILACLSDEDVTIRSRALNLLPGMASRKNLMELVSQLLQHVEFASGDYKLELVRVIVGMCSGEKYSLLTDFGWYLETLFTLGHIRGLDSQADLLRSQVTDVALRVLPIRTYAVKRSIEILLEGEQINADQNNILHGDNGRGRHIMPEILPALAWIVGEYSDLIPEVLGMDDNAVYIYNTESEGPYHSVVQVLSAPVNQVKLPGSTQKVYVQGAIKVFAAATANSQVSDVELEACTKALADHLPVFMQSTHAEVQERACRAHALLQSLAVISDSTGVGSVPGLLALDEDENDDNDGNLLGLSGTKSTPTQPTIGGSTASKCREAAVTLNYLLKPSPMKPTGAKSQRKKHQAPIGVSLDTIQKPPNLDIFAGIIEEEKAHRARAKWTLESVSFTQQRPHRAAVPTHTLPQQPQIMNLDSVSSETALNMAPGLTTAGSGSMLPRSNMGGDRPQGSNDPFYLNSKPSVFDDDEDNTPTAVGLANRFGTIQLGESDDDSQNAPDMSRKKRKKKKKDKKSKSSEVDVMQVFGGDTGGQKPSVILDDDDEDDMSGIPTSRGQKPGRNKEFKGLAMVDLTTPLQEDEVMPERKHRVVPERLLQPEPSPLGYAADKSSKKKKKKKESKKKKKATTDTSGVGDLLGLGGMTMPSQAPSIQSTESSTAMGALSISSPAPAPAPMPAPIMQSNNNAINSAFDDLLSFNSTPVPQLAGALPALPAAQPAPDLLGNLSTSLVSSPLEVQAQPIQPIQSVGNGLELPWIRASVKVSHAAGSPIVDWSKIQLCFRAQKTGQSPTSVSVVFRATNLMEMSPLRDLSLQLKDFGKVPLGNVASGASAESAAAGPFPYGAVDSPRELKGTMGSADCTVPIKIILPASASFSPTPGLTLEQVANELASSPWSSHSAKLALSAPQGNVKSLLSNYLGMTEVEPEASGPSNGTFACRSGSGASIRVLLKIKKDKVKIDFKCSNPQLAEAVMSDLKRLVL